MHSTESLLATTGTLMNKIAFRLTLVGILLVAAACQNGAQFPALSVDVSRTLPSRLIDNSDAPEDGRVTRYETWDIPQYVDPNPNVATLRWYFRRHLDDPRGFGKYSAKAAATPSAFKRDVRSNAFLTRQMSETGLVSYLFYDNGVIVHDEKSPPNRLGDMITDDTPLTSNSIGKSMTSYLLGHAICTGVIDGLDARIDDWPLFRNTVYNNQRLIDLVNMRAGDAHVVSDSKGLLKSGRWYNVHTMGSFAREELNGTSPKGREGSRPYHYNGLATNIVLNYILFKAGDDFDELMDSLFAEKAGVENDVFFMSIRGGSSADANARYSFYASRYDYLRIARAMLGDWSNDTCVGRYLKEIAARSKRKNDRHHDPYDKFDSALGYGGFFHTDYPGMVGRNVFGLDGYGGQYVMIDFDNARIVVVNSVTIDYNWYQLVHQAIANGRLPTPEDT